MKKIFSIYLLLIIITVNAIAAKSVDVATLFDYAPYCMGEKNIKFNQHIKVGEDALGFKGYSWDILRESYHAMGYDIDLFISPWARAMHVTKNSTVDILFPTGKNKKREKLFNYSNQSINEAIFLLYTNANNTLKWDGLKSLKGLRIAVIRGYNFGDEWSQTKGIVKIPINGILQGFRMLEANRIDGFIGYEDNWDYVLNKEDIKYKFKKFPSFGSSSEYLVALKSNQKGKDLLEVFDEGKQKLIINGKLKQIKTKWFGK